MNAGHLLILITLLLQPPVFYLCQKDSFVAISMVRFNHLNRIMQFFFIPSILLANK